MSNVSHTIGDGPFTPGQPPFEGPWNDVRDVIVKAPRFGGHGYATLETDDGPPLFPVRHKIIRELDPQPETVFEFGSLLGYFLMTAVDAAPSIARAGWIDTERDQPGSNEFCAENVKYVRSSVDTWYSTRTRDCLEFGQADLVQVDGAHSFPDCLTDLIWALELCPATIMIDDYKAIPEVKRAADVFAKWVDRPLEYHETVNGLAVIRRV